MRFLLLFIIMIIGVGCTATPKEKKEKVKNLQKQATDIQVYDYNTLKPLLHKNNNKTYIVNFWATWCAPCVKELPAFEKIQTNYSNKNVVVLLVSLDFPKQIEKKLTPFLKEKNIQSTVVLLDDDNEQYWINDISTTWSGALPATLIYNKNKRKFYEQSFNYKELQIALETFLNG